LPFSFFSPHPHVKHYHIKQNSRGEFFLSEKHCCGSIPDLVNYHKHNSGGLASRLKTSPCDRPVPATAGLSHGMYKLVTLFPFASYEPPTRIQQYLYLLDTLQNQLAHINM